MAQRLAPARCGIHNLAVEALRLRHWGRLSDPRTLSGQRSDRRPRAGRDYRFACESRCAADLGTDERFRSRAVTRSASALASALICRPTADCHDCTNASIWVGLKGSRTTPSTPALARPGFVANRVRTDRRPTRPQLLKTTTAGPHWLHRPGGPAVGGADERGAAPRFDAGT